MSDSSYKLTASSRRKSPNRRLIRRSVEHIGSHGANQSRNRNTHQEAVGKTLKPKKVRPLSGGNSNARKKGKALVPVTKSSTPTAIRRIPPLKPGTGKLTTVRVKKQKLPRKVRASRKTRLKPMARTILYALRLLIVGVGIGAIMGTVLSVLDPAHRITTTGVSSNNNQVEQIPSQPTTNPLHGAGGLFLSQELPTLKSTVTNLVTKNTNLTPGIFLVDLDNGTYVDINAAASFPAASTIKTPILVAFFQDVDAGKIRLDEMLIMEQGMIAGGSGNMKSKQPGTQFTALEVATKMMTISDNTATNMLIERMGGMEILNQRFRSWGLRTTAIRNPLPDVEGTNTTSPKELATLMAMVSKGNLVSMRSRDRILDIMRRNTRNHLLPVGLGKGAIIAHKTGNIGSMLADAGLVDLPTGKRYLAAVMVQRPRNDPSAAALIQSISRAAYQQFNQLNPVPNVYPSPKIVPGVPVYPSSTVPRIPNGYIAPGMNTQYYNPQS
ncbi:serine hydrolase [Calothrix rhizosoleniae]|uniref:serine hydrolase n=1 Tax=Calothrix rhizosoleniae TaxID=888997 RepID=UPI000B49DB16|nr:serine hydrolase [Calothrix rhizosoleniae]